MAVSWGAPPARSRQFLVIEDERDLAGLIELHLKDLGARVELCHDGVTGLARAREQRWDLIVLDLMLPRLDGLELCRELRLEADAVPIFMLTARSTELDRVLGLEIGADEYLTKPFSPVELVARAKALLRRAEYAFDAPAERPCTLDLGELLLDRSNRELRVRDQPVELTPREFDLLWFFASHPNRVFRRSELLDHVWGRGHVGYEHTVNSHINRLRNKIERDASQPRHLLTVWGVGYKFRAEA